MMGRQNFGRIPAYSSLGFDDLALHRIWFVHGGCCSHALWKRALLSEAPRERGKVLRAEVEIDQPNHVCIAYHFTWIPVENEEGIVVSQSMLCYDHVCVDVLKGGRHGLYHRLHLTL
jgi:hypothetical protein